MLFRSLFMLLLCPSFCCISLRCVCVEMICWLVFASSYRDPGIAGLQFIMPTHNHYYSTRTHLLLGVPKPRGVSRDVSGQPAISKLGIARCRLILYHQNNHFLLFFFFFSSRLTETLSPSIAIETALQNKHAKFLPGCVPRGLQAPWALSVALLSTVPKCLPPTSYIHVRALLVPWPRMRNAQQAKDPAAGKSYVT